MLRGLLRRDCWTLRVIIVLIFMDGVNSLQKRTGRGKGVMCKRNEECDETRFLECVVERCSCRSDSGWIWVPDEHSCMIMEKFGCARNGMKGDCVPNSSCFEGSCECDDPYLRNGLGGCERSWGMNCSNMEPCSKRYSLDCPQNGSGQRKCECLDEGKTFVWDVDKQKCVSRAGGACDLENNQGFGFENNEVDEVQLECILNSYCANDTDGRGVCKCKAGFKQTADGNCFAQYGSPCDSSYPSMGAYCNKNEGLICLDGKCSCPFHQQMKYDQETQQCRVLVGEGCSTNQSAPIGAQLVAQNDLVLICVRDAFCKPRPGLTRGICTCNQGLEKTPDSSCTKFKAHGQLCSSSMDCDRDRFMECAFSTNQRQSCECLHNLMRWDGKQCRVLPGQSCLENSVCSPNSYCEGTWCVCNIGYKIDPSNSECVQKTQEISSLTGVLWHDDHSPSSCDLYPEGTLERKKCQCELSLSSHIWLEEKSSCLALVGAPCQMDSHCIPHAKCDTRESTCQCSPSALTTAARHCALSNLSLTSTNKQLVQVSLHNHQDNESSSHNHDWPESQTLKSIRIVENDGEANNYANSGDTTRTKLEGGFLIHSPLVSVIMSQSVSIVFSRLK